MKVTEGDQLGKSFYKKLLKTDHILKRKMQNYKTFGRKKIEVSLEDLGLGKEFLDLTASTPSIEGKNGELYITEIKTLLYQDC